MAGQSRALVVLGGLLAVGIGAAVWLTTAGTSPETDAARDAGTSTAPDESAKPSVAGPKRPKPKGSASVVGEVRRSKGRVPVADQEVQLVPEKGDPWTVRTDARGGFKLTEIPHGGPYELRVAANGCGTIRIPGMALDRGEKRDVGTLWLDPAVRVSVQVRAWSDEPVAGALVEAFAVPAADNFDWSKAMAQMGQTPVAVTKATTDAKGEATFAELAVGRWTFAATKTGFGRAGRTTSLRSDVPTPPVKLHLGTGHPLTGRVFDSAKNPVAGAQVLAGQAGSSWDLGASALRSRATTDDQGRYQFASLESGDAQLMVARAGGIPGAVATLKIPNVRQFDVYLKGAATVTGTVTEKDGGKPVEGATVRAFSYATGGSAAPSEATTDAEGKYSLVVSAGAVSQIAAEKEGFASADDPMKQQQPMQIREGETQSRDLKLRPGCRVTGVVKGPDGPVSAAKVMVTTGSSDRGWSTKSASTDADGKYEVGSLIPGKAIVRADAAGLYVKDFPENYWMVLQSTASSPFKLDVSEGQTAVKDLEMIRGAVLEGRVDGPDGPLAGVRVSLPQDYEGGVVTGADGAFRIDGAKPSQTVQALLAKEGYAPSTSNRPFAVAADQPTTGVVLKMSRVLVVKGVVSAADGAPIRDGKVTASSWSDRSDGGGVSPMMYSGVSGGPSAAAPIHADGSFEVALTGPTGNKVRVTATAFEHPPATSEPVAVSEGQAECVINVNLDGGKDLQGKVVVKQGGAPVAGAQISVQPRAPRSSGTNTVTMPATYDGGFYGRGGGGQTVWAVSDSEGRFAIPHLAPGTYAFTARADGYVAGSATVDLAAADAVTIEIETELSIEGVVTMQDGSPVEGASVGASRDAPASAEPRSTSPSMMSMTGMGGGSTTTGVGGWFRVSGLSGGGYRLTVSGARQSDLNIRTKKTELIAAGTKDVKVVVDAGGIIAGRVLDPQKRGASGIGIYANPEQNNGKPVAGAEGRQARTKEDGTFTVVGLADVTTYAVTVQASQGWDMSGGSTWKNATVKGVAVGTNNVEIALEEGLTITGVVVDGEGKPVANSYLFCTVTATEGKSRQSRNAMTDAAGAFTVGGLDAGDCTFTLQSAGVGGALVLQNGDKVAVGSRDVRLVATKGLSITGTVVDESGAPVKSAMLNAAAKTGGRGGYAQSQDDGAFEIGGLATGAVYTVTATASGRARGKIDDVAAGASAVRIVVPKGLEASGRVLDDKGAPVKGGQIVVHLAGDPNQSQAAAIDDSGNFTLKGLVEGTYEARAMAKSATDRAWHNCGTLKAGDAGVELRMEP